MSKTTIAFTFDKTSYSPNAIRLIPKNQPSGSSEEGKADRLHAFVGVMRSAGLSILDTTIQERTRLAVDDRLELYRHKAGKPVYLPLEPELADELRRLATIPGGDPRYFF